MSGGAPDFNQADAAQGRWEAEYDAWLEETQPERRLTEARLLEVNQWLAEVTEGAPF